MEIQNSRFALLSPEDMEKLSSNSKNKNTTRSTNNWITVFRHWATVRGKNINLEEYAVKVLGIFFREIRKQNGKDMNRIH